MTAAIPIVDVAALSSGSRADLEAIARELGTAARTIGFFAIRGHGIPAELRAEVFAAARRFFELPIAEKERLAIDRIGDNRGWVSIGTEALDPSTAPDPKEAFNLGWDPPEGSSRNPWPTLDGFRPTMEAWFAAVTALGLRLHRALAVDLGADADYFADKFATPMATLRLLHYPPRPAGTEGYGAGAHTDYGNLTLLATDEAGGLEVRTRDGAWIAAPVLADAFVVNIGDCLMRWSNDVYLSNPHRVVAPVGRDRLSVAFFLDPSPEAVVAALPSCVPAGAAPKYPPITARDHLAERLAASYRAALGDERASAVTPERTPGGISA